ncbi:MAG: META domain-containing protein, partial [Saprospiraceae bacterium]|nr:META domain-containing protein [Saprospiraceae bacterium]
SCGPEKRNENELPVAQNSTKDTVKLSMNHSNDSEIYFTATGTEPFWRLSISNEMIKLKLLNDSIMTPHVTPIYAQDTNVKRYVLQTELATMTIEIKQKPCTEEMSGKVSSYSVSLRYKKGINSDYSNLEGCGSYQTDYRLHDIWILEEMHGKPVDKQEFGKSVPSMEINTRSNSFTGTTGCNRMNGNIFYEKDKLRFTEMITTKMMCLPDPTNEQTFLKALSSAVSYKIEANRLILSNPHQILLVWRKTD